MQQALIGVDIGTSNIKAVAFSVDGQTIGANSLPTPTHYPQNNWAEYEADDIWQCICSCLQSLVKELSDDYELAGVSFSSMAEAAFPLNDKAQVIHPAIAWFDNRVLTQLKWWQEQVGSDHTAAITGLNPATAAGVLRLLWIRDEHPSIYKDVKRWLNMSDFGVFKLCAESITDYSLASRMMTMDLATRKWSNDILDKIDINQSVFGELVSSGTKVGLVTSAASKQTGLPEGLPVSSGGHDHICASLGLGITDTGEVFDSMGTAEVVMASFEKPVLRNSISQLGIDQGCHVIPDRYYAITGLPFSGGSLDWIRNSLSLDYSEFISLAAETPIGSDGIFYLSSLRETTQPTDDPFSSKAFTGINNTTNLGHLARAVMEGLAYEYQQIFDKVTDAFSLSPTTLVASGGSTRNTTLMGIKANVSGLPISIPEVDEAACLGAALLAGIGAGVYKDFNDANEQVHYSSKTITFDEATHKTYRNFYEKTFLKTFYK